MATDHSFPGQCVQIPHVSLKEMREGAMWRADRLGTACARTLVGRVQACK